MNLYSCLHIIVSFESNDQSVQEELVIGITTNEIKIGSGMWSSEKEFIKTILQHTDDSDIKAASIEKISCCTYSEVGKGVFENFPWWYDQRKGKWYPDDITTALKG